MDKWQNKIRLVGVGCRAPSLSTVTLYFQPSRLVCEKYVRKRNGAVKNAYDGLETAYYL